MHQVRSVFFEKLRQAIGERQVQIARTKQILHSNPGLSGNPVDAGVWRTHQRIVMTALA